MDDIKKEVEAVLFAAGRAVSLSEMESLLSVNTPGLVKEAISELKQGYSERDSPILLIDEGDGWKLTVKEKFLPIVHRVNPHTELSKAVMETLAVVAWKQPILQSEVIRIRTNKAYDHIKELATLGFLIKEREGRSYSLKVTQKFMEYFDLPNQEAVQEMFKDFKDVKMHNPEKENKNNVKKIDSEEFEDGIAPEKLGKLEVYDENEVYTPVRVQNKGDGAEVEKTLGDLGVYSEEKTEGAEESVQSEQTEKVASEEQNLSPEEELSEEEKSRLQAKELAESLLDEDKIEDSSSEVMEEEKLDPALEKFEDKLTSEEVLEDKKLEEKIAPSGEPQEESAEIETTENSTLETTATEETATEDSEEEIPAHEKPIVEVGVERTEENSENDSEVDVQEEVAPEDIPHTDEEAPVEETETTEQPDEEEKQQ